MANLIVGADGVAMDPDEKPPQTPQEVIAAAGEQRPGIEDQDINDGWLIEHTAQLDCGNGMMKYSITLPDGLPFECTPFRIENRRDMSKVWMSAVRQEIVNRASAAADITKAQALKARRDKQMQGPGLLVTDQLPTPEEAAALAASVKQAPPPPPESARKVIAQIRDAEVAPLPQTAPAASADPIEHARRQFDQAMAELDHWNDLEAKASRNAKAAHKAALRWKTILDAFSESETVPKASAQVSKASATRAEKAARRLQTSIVASSK